MALHGTIVLAFTSLYPGFWIVPASISATWFFSIVASRVMFGSERLERAKNFIDSHAYMHEEIAEIERLIRENGGLATAAHVDAIFSLFFRGCLHVQKDTSRILGGSRVHFEGYQRLKFHAGRMQAGSAHFDDVWIVVRAKELELRRYLTEVHERLHGSPILNPESQQSGK